MNENEQRLARDATGFPLEACLVAKLLTRFEAEREQPELTFREFIDYARCPGGLQMARRWFSKARAAGVVMEVVRGSGQGVRSVWCLTDLGNRLGALLVEVDRLHAEGTG